MSDQHMTGYGSKILKMRQICPFFMMDACHKPVDLPAFRQKDVR